uniref:Uncharacterized protein n=1 Tax=Vespula pensylvanica TaxID=30213 RepID=A0A834UEQ8_VESPE|nr:hypothetical protein H0235_003485 [Vespula pensylvanica]
MRRMSKGCQGLFGEGARQTTRSIQPGIPYTRGSIGEASFQRAFSAVAFGNDDRLIVAERPKQPLQKGGVGG